MEKRSTGKRTSRKSAVRDLRLLLPTRYIITGESGTRYEFPGSGSVLQVLENDAVMFLQKRVSYLACCGGGEQNLPIFEEA